jgi:hypothetical protein
MLSEILILVLRKHARDIDLAKSSTMEFELGLSTAHLLPRHERSCRLLRCVHRFTAL